MDQIVTSHTNLTTVALGHRARITAILGGHSLHRRLLGLGLRVGSEIDIVHQRGRSVVVAAAGNRIALGGGIAEKLLIEHLPPSSNNLGEIPV